jgi:hypothetical protein
MPGKQPPNKSVAVRLDTYQILLEIVKLPHMMSPDGLTRSFTDVVDEVFKSYLKAHQKGKR